MRSTTRSARCGFCYSVRGPVLRLSARRRVLPGRKTWRGTPGSPTPSHALPGGAARAAGESSRGRGRPCDAAGHGRCARKRGSVRRLPSPVLEVRLLVEERPAGQMQGDFGGRTSSIHTHQSPCTAHPGLEGRPAPCRRAATARGLESCEPAGRPCLRVRQSCGPPTLQAAVAAASTVTPQAALQSFLEGEGPKLTDGSRDEPPLAKFEEQINRYKCDPSLTADDCTITRMLALLPTRHVGARPAAWRSGAGVPPSTRVRWSRLRRALSPARPADARPATAHFTWPHSQGRQRRGGRPARERRGGLGKGQRQASQAGTGHLGLQMDLPVHTLPPGAADTRGGTADVP